MGKLNIGSTSASQRSQRLGAILDKLQLIDYSILGEYCKSYAQKNKDLIETLNDKDWEEKHQKELSEFIVRHRALIR